MNAPHLHLHNAARLTALVHNTEVFLGEPPGDSPTHESSVRYHFWLGLLIIPL